METVKMVMMFHMVPMSGHNDRHFRVMHNEVCHTSGKGAPNGAFPATTNDDEVGCFFIG